jgi:hypothetical protein
MIKNRKAKLALVHIAKKRTGIDDNAYRAILSGEGLASAADIETEAQFSGIMLAFKNLGFVCEGKPAAPAGSPPRIGGSEWQAAKIWGLWQGKARSPNREALRKFVKRVAAVDDPLWLDAESAQKVILALKAMRGRG